MSNIRITGIELVDEPSDVDQKSRVLATFSFEMSGLRFSEWALVQFRNGNVRAFPPRSKDGGMIIYIQDRDFHELITGAATAVYEKLEDALQ